MTSRFAAALLSLLAGCGAATGPPLVEAVEFLPDVPARAPGRVWTVHECACAQGETCCNPVCGICVPRGAACPAIGCE